MNDEKYVRIFDTTLRDGMQGQGMSLSAQEKARVVRKLDELGVHYIEAGFPTSNPKEVELFEMLSNEELATATVVAFGMTRRRDAAARASVFDQLEGVGPARRLRGVDDLHARLTGVDPGGLAARHRVVGAHGGAGAEQVGDQRPAGRLAHIVRIGLECQAPQSDGAPLEFPTEMPFDLLEQRGFLPAIDLFHGIQHDRRIAALYRGL